MFMPNWTHGNFLEPKLWADGKTQLSDADVITNHAMENRSIATDYICDAQKGNNTNPTKVRKINDLVQDCIPVGCVLSAAVAACLGGGGVCPGVSAQGVAAQGGVPAQGVSAGGCVYTSSLWTEFLIHTCENINFLQLRLRTVIT